MSRDKDARRVMAATGMRYSRALDAVRLRRVNGTIKEYLQRIDQVDDPGMFGRCLDCLEELPGLGVRCPCKSKSDRLVVRGIRARTVEPAPCSCSSRPGWGRR